MNIKNFLIKIFATFFYVGCLPAIPGTFGSLAGIGVYLLVSRFSYIYWGTVLFFIIFGIAVSSAAEDVLGKKDAPCIVIDEVAGILISFLFLPFDIRLIVIGFLIFRILDALKPFPINRLQCLRGGWGVMSDDIIAGVYTNIILQFVLKFVSVNAS